MATDTPIAVETQPFDLSSRTPFLSFVLALRPADMWAGLGQCGRHPSVPKSSGSQPCRGVDGGSRDRDGTAAALEPDLRSTRQRGQRESARAR
jgi:hypothetical protein